MPAAEVSVASRTNGPIPHLKGGNENGVRNAGNAEVLILDIRRAAVEINIKENILTQFHTETGPRALPTLLLYDEKGLQLFERVNPVQ